MKIGHTKTQPGSQREITLFAFQIDLLHFHTLKKL